LIFPWSSFNQCLGLQIPLTVTLFLFVSVDKNLLIVPGFFGVALRRLGWLSLRFGTSVDKGMRLQHFHRLRLGLKSLSHSCCCACAIRCTTATAIRCTTATAISGNEVQ